MLSTVTVWPTDAVWLPMTKAAGVEELAPALYACGTGAIDSTDEPIDTVAGTAAACWEELAAAAVATANDIAEGVAAVPA